MRRRRCLLRRRRAGADNTGELVADSAQLVFDALRLTRIDGELPQPTQDGPPPRSDDGGCTTGPGAGLWMIAMWLGARRRRRPRAAILRR